MRLDARGLGRERKKKRRKKEKRKKCSNFGGRQARASRKKKMLRDLFRGGARGPLFQPTILVPSRLHVMLFFSVRVASQESKIRAPTKPGTKARQCASQCERKHGEENNCALSNLQLYHTHILSRLTETAPLQQRAPRRERERKRKGEKEKCFLSCHPMDFSILSSFVLYNAKLLHQVRLLPSNKACRAHFF